MDARDPGVEQRIESFDQADDLDAELVGANDSAVNGGVEGRGITAGGQDADALHGRGSVEKERGRFGPESDNPREQCRCHSYERAR